MDYQGNERRRHRIIVTRNTEYHLKDDLVVAVRDRGSKRWCEGHIALALKVEGGVRFYDNGAVVPSLEPPSPGDAMYFTYKNDSGHSRQLITSKIEAVERTPKRDVLAYATLGIRRGPAKSHSAAQKPS